MSWGVLIIELSGNFGRGGGDYMEYMDMIKFHICDWSDLPELK